MGNDSLGKSVMRSGVFRVKLDVSPLGPALVLFHVLPPTLLLLLTLVIKGRVAQKVSTPPAGLGLFIIMHLMRIV